MKKMKATKLIAMGGFHIKPGQIYYVSEIKGSRINGREKTYRLCRTKSRQSVCASVPQSTIDTMVEMRMD